MADNEKIEINQKAWYDDMRTSMSKKMKSFGGFLMMLILVVTAAGILWNVPIGHLLIKDIEIDEENKRLRFELIEKERAIGSLTGQLDKTAGILDMVLIEEGGPQVLGQSTDFAQLQDQLSQASETVKDLNSRLDGLITAHNEQARRFALLSEDFTEISGWVCLHAGSKAVDIPYCSRLDNGDN